MNYVALENLLRYSGDEGREALKRGCKRFNELHGWATGLMKEFSALLGWRGDWPLSFEGFEGWHIELKADSISFMHGVSERGVIELRDDASVAFLGPVFERRTEAQCQDFVEDVILADRNLSDAQHFVGLGSFKVEGFFRVDPEENVCVSHPEIPGYDLALKEYFRDSGDFDVRLLGRLEYGALLEKELGFPKEDVGGVVVQRKASPVLLEMNFDGKRFDDYREYFQLASDYDTKKAEEDFRAYSENKHFLVRLCDSLNAEMVSVSSLSSKKDRDALYHFPHAKYLMTGMNISGLNVVSSYGRRTELMVFPGTAGFKVLESAGRPARMMSGEQVKRLLRDTVLSKQNINLMNEDFRRSGKSMGDAGTAADLSKGVDDKVSQVKFK